jgi:adenylate kinase family enzyme
MEYYDKYLKYKKKYLLEKEKQANNIQLGSNVNHALNHAFNLYGGKHNVKMILVDGTSSAGKTTICEYFSTKDYECYKIDDYINDRRVDFTKLLKKIKNNYGEENKIYMGAPVKYMIDDAISEGKDFLLDHISQKEIIDYMKKKRIYQNLFIINVFTNLETLARNLESRRKEGDKRGIFAFKQFAERYIKTDKNDSKRIETVNRKAFRKILLDKFKYEFKDEEALKDFANYVFKLMKITDDKDHYVKLRDNYECDYLLITSGKTKKDIFMELEENI